MTEYNYESEGEIKKTHKPHRNRERKRTNLFIKKLREEGAICWRFPDGLVKNPYDGYIQYGSFMPFEAKYMDGGQTFNVMAWIKKQPHQYKNLLRAFATPGTKPFFLIHHKVKGRHKDLAMPIHSVPRTKLELSRMKEIKCLDDLIRM